MPAVRSLRFLSTRSGVAQLPGETRGGLMAKIPKILQTHIDTAFPANVCLVGSVLSNGFAQVSPRGSTMVFDDTHIGLWEPRKRSTPANPVAATPFTPSLP